LSQRQRAGDLPVERIERKRRFAGIGPVVVAVARFVVNDVVANKSLVAVEIVFVLVTWPDRVSRSRIDDRWQDDGGELARARKGVKYRFRGIGKFKPETVLTPLFAWLRSQVASMPTRPSWRRRPCRRVFFAPICARTKKGALCCKRRAPRTRADARVPPQRLLHSRNTSFRGGEIAMLYGAQTGKTRLRRLVRFHA